MDGYNYMMSCIIHRSGTAKPEMQYTRPQELRSHDLDGGLPPRTPCENSPEYDQLEEYELMVQQHAVKTHATHRQRAPVPTANNVAYETMQSATQSLDPMQGCIASGPNTKPVGPSEAPTTTQEVEYEIIPYTL